MVSNPLYGKSPDYTCFDNMLKRRKKNQGHQLSILPIWEKKLGLFVYNENQAWLTYLKKTDMGLLSNTRITC